MGERKIISIILPVYKEERTIGSFLDALAPFLVSLEKYDHEILCVNDGSPDATLQELLKSREKHGNKIKILDLSRNFGKEAAMTSGIDAAGGDAVIPMDCDFQDPIEVIPELVKKWEEGYDVVLARRIDRSADSWVKRLTAGAFYWFFNRISDLSIPDNVGDFRLMSRSVVEVFKRLPEKRRFMKGLFAWVGYNTAMVDYMRKERASGRSKFNYLQLWNLALEGLISFTSIPLRLWMYFGVIIAATAFCFSAFIVVRTLIYGIDVPGYASLLTVSLFLGGVQLVGLGIMGEYIGGIYMEVKGRPIYLVKTFYK